MINITQNIMKHGFVKGLLTGIIISVATMIGCSNVNEIRANNNKKADNGTIVTIGTPSPAPTDIAKITVTPAPTAPAATCTPVPTAAYVADNKPTNTPLPTSTPTPTPSPTPVLDPITEYTIFDETFISKIQLLESCLEKYYKDVSVKVIQEAVYHAMMDAVGDPYTLYFEQQELTDFQTKMEGVYYGIGSYVSQDKETMVVTLTEPFEEGPAYEAGVRAGDILVAVDGKDISGIILDDIVTLLKGPENTTVKVTVKRGEQLLDFVVTRRPCETPVVSYEMHDNNVAYLRITEFNDKVAKQFKTKADKAVSDGAKGLVIDLRSNPGGYLERCIEVADYILPKGSVIVSTESQETRTYVASLDHYIDLPIVILVDGYSASASEVFTGALKDNEWAVVMGTQSYGKGIVQSVWPFTDGSGVKVTTARYLTPSGICVQGIGITPDIIVEYDGSDVDNQKEEAIKYITTLLNGK